MMSQSLEILNCDEHLIFMDTFSNGDINHVVSEAYFFSNLVGEAYSLKYLNGRATFFLTIDQRLHRVGIISD